MWVLRRRAWRVRRWEGDRDSEATPVRSVGGAWTIRPPFRTMTTTRTVVGTLRVPSRYPAFSDGTRSVPTTLKTPTTEPRARARHAAHADPVEAGRGPPAVGRGGDGPVRAQGTAAGRAQAPHRVPRFG